MMKTETLTPPAQTPTLAPSGTTCPHCHKPFDGSVDSRQPPRLQGAKCPHCKLFVPARHITVQPALTREERQRRG